jgi:hypothetical protein
VQPGGRPTRISRSRRLPAVRLLSFSFVVRVPFSFGFSLVSPSVPGIVEVGTFHSSHLWKGSVMSGRIAFVAFLSVAVGASECAAQKEAKGKAKSTSKEIIELLNERVELKGFLNPMTLHEFIDVLYRSVPADRRVPITLNWKAFSEENPDRYPDLAAVFNLEVPPVVPPAMADQALTRGHILRLGLYHVPTNNATYVIRNGTLEITTNDHAHPRAQWGQRVSACFEKRPLDEALDELVEQTGAAVVVDSRVGDKAKTPVTATFRNTTTLENAVRILAELADLQADLDDYAIVVTGKPKVEAPQAELKFRGRWLDLALADLARWKGTTIVLDPEVNVNKVSLGEGKIRRIELVELTDKPGGHGPKTAAAPTYKVTATLKPSISAEAAVRIVADQAHLSVVVMEGAFYVTTQRKAERLRSEMKERK